ncbi:arylamine N-acetyltransferase [Salmonella enterica subsp. enterica]|nr:arylamine N-acetyltransferase [Salmonella enterica subsp. enterica]
MGFGGQTPPLRLQAGAQQTPHGEYRLMQEGSTWLHNSATMSTGGRCTVLIWRWQRRRSCDGRISGRLFGLQSHFRHHLLMCRHLPDGGKLAITNFPLHALPPGTCR